CHGGTMEWSLPVRHGSRWTAGNWHEYDGTLQMCSLGLHLTTAPYADWAKWGMAVYEAEAEGIGGWDGNKCVAKRVRLLNEQKPPAYWSKAIEFVESIKTLGFCNPDGKPLTEWKVFI